MLVASPQTAAHLLLRSRIILGAADGLSDAEIGRTLHTEAGMVAHWREIWSEQDAIGPDERSAEARLTTTTWQRVRFSRSISIAGCFFEAPRPTIAGVPDRNGKIPIGRAPVLIVDGPPIDRQKVAACRQTPGWEESAKRFDRTLSRPDGTFRLLNLPCSDSGPVTYVVQVSPPAPAGRYQAVTAEMELHKRPTPEQVTVREFELPTSRICGQVTFNGSAVHAARVWIEDDKGMNLSEILITGGDGIFDFRALQVSSATTREGLQRANPGHRFASWRVVAATDKIIQDSVTRLRAITAVDQPAVGRAVTLEVPLVPI